MWAHKHNLHPMDPTKKELYTAKRPSGLDTSSHEVHQVINQLRSDDDPTNWLILKVQGTTVIVHGSGSGGIGEFSAALNDDDVYYGTLRCTADGMVKFYHVLFVGQNLSGLKKGRASLYKSAIFQLIDAHGEIVCSTGTEDYSDAFVVSSIAKQARATNIAF